MTKLTVFLRSRTSSQRFSKHSPTNSIDIEARNWRINLLFRGIKETRNENCLVLVMEFFLVHTLQIDMGIKITRAHRLGPTKVGQTFSRHIIVNFMKYNNVELIMPNAKSLRHCPIDRDMPKYIVNARTRLLGKFKDIKNENPGSSVNIVYPAKLLCGNRVVQDEFPGWHAALNKSRIVSLPVLETLGRKHVEAVSAYKIT